MTKKIQKYKTELYERNAKRSQKKTSASLFQDFESFHKEKIEKNSKLYLDSFSQERIESSEQLRGLEITLIGRIKGAAKARKTTTGLSGTLKPQTILGSEYYSIAQRQVYTKWGTLGLTVRNSIRVSEKS